MRRIRDTLPDARLIVIVRDPVERAHSNWTHLWSAGLEPIGDFVRACGEEERRIAAGWASFWHYVGLGRYGEQLEDLFTLFPREQVLVLRYRLLVDEPLQSLDRICSFLGVETGVLTEIPRHNVTSHPESTLAHSAVSLAQRAATAVGTMIPGLTAATLTGPLERFLQRHSRERQPLSWEQRQELLPGFETDIKLLEDVLGESFADWSRPRERSGGMVPPDIFFAICRPAPHCAVWCGRRNQDGRLSRTIYNSKTSWDSITMRGGTGPAGITTSAWS